MKTNKFLLIALAAAGLFTACSNNNEAVKPNQGNAISFRLQGGMPAAKTTASTDANVDAFVVYGNDDKTLTMFNGVTVARQIVTGAPAGFSYAPTRYYDVTATVAAFVAYSPASTVFNAVSAANVLGALSTFTYTVPAPVANGNTSQIDLLFAVEGSVDPTAGSAVQLDFTHALSRVFVAAKNTTDDPVTIKKLTLKGLCSQGTITVPAGAASWSWGGQTNTTTLYEYVLAPTGVIVPGDGASAAYKLVTSMEQGMMILPQDLTAACKLEVVYEFANLATQTKEFDISSNTSSITEFVENNQYSINLEFTGTTVRFEIGVDGFDSIEDVDIP